MYKTTPNEVTLTWNSSENIVTNVLQTWKPKENTAKTFMSQGGNYDGHFKIFRMDRKWIY